MMNFPIKKETKNLEKIKESNLEYSKDIDEIE
jgi:hypothetical protein